MNKRASIPVSLPHSNPTQSYWQDPPDEIAHARSTEALPQEADIVVIGSGITGAAVAWNLLQNCKHDILMLEARQACSGATGRNGGHTKAASYRSFPHHTKEYGTDVAAQIARLELDNIRAVHAFARDHSISCDSNPCETVDVIYDKAQWEHDQAAVKAMRDALPGHPAAEYNLHTPDEVRQKFYCGQGGDENVCGGITYEAGSISAYKFGIGVLKLCLDRGLNLQTNTPAIVMKKTVAGKWEIETPRGRITARKVILATNGYTAGLFKRFQGLIVPTRGHVTAQRPGKNMPAEGLSRTYSFIYHNGFEYMIPRPKESRFEGDLVIGGGLVKAPDDGLMEFGTTDDTSANPIIEKALYDCLPQFFGDNWGYDHSDGRIRKQWTGIMGYSPDNLPYVGEVPGEKNLWMSCSFQGHGMVLCWMCARALVELMEGRDGNQLRAWFPPVFRVSEDRMGKTFAGRLSH